MKDMDLPETYRGTVEWLIYPKISGDVTPDGIALRRQLLINASRFAVASAQTGSTPEAPAADQIIVLP